MIPTQDWKKTRHAQQVKQSNV